MFSHEFSHAQSILRVRGGSSEAVHDQATRVMYSPRTRR